MLKNKKELLNRINNKAQKLVWKYEESLDTFGIIYSYKFMQSESDEIIDAIQQYVDGMIWGSDTEEQIEVEKILVENGYLELEEATSYYPTIVNIEDRELNEEGQEILNNYIKELEDGRKIRATKEQSIEQYKNSLLKNTHYNIYWTVNERQEQEVKTDINIWYQYDYKEGYHGAMGKLYIKTNTEVEADEIFKTRMPKRWKYVFAVNEIENKRIEELKQIYVKEIFIE